MSMRHVPNLISVSRILLSFLLPFFFLNTSVFVVLYILIGITDALDGFIARKYKVESALGARLDSLGDLVFYLVITGYLVTEQKNVVADFLVFILLILGLRVANMIIGLIRYRKLIMIHTLANKLTGFLVFALPILIISGTTGLLYVIVAIAIFSPVEELIMLLQGTKDEGIDINRKSIFMN